MKIPPLDNLPQWAQKLIKILEGRVTVLERALKELQDSKTPSYVWVTDNTLDMGDRYYLQTDRITFEHSPGTTLQVHIEDGRLVITGVGLGYALDVRPHVANQVSIGSVER